MNYRSNGKIAKANVCIPRWWRRRRGEKDEGGVALGLKLGLWVNLRQNGGLFCKVIRGHLATRSWRRGRRRALWCEEEQAVFKKPDMVETVPFWIVSNKISSFVLAF